ncbi:MAG: Ig-like domain-containing protein [Bacteroidota bacterium]
MSLQKKRFRWDYWASPCRWKNYMKALRLRAKTYRSSNHGRLTYLLFLILILGIFSPLKSQTNYQWLIEKGKYVGIFLNTLPSDSLQIFTLRSPQPIWYDYISSPEHLPYQVTLLPALGFQAGQSYTFLVGTDTLLQVTPPDSASPPPSVQHIYPDAKRVPANLLKLYIHFEVPMADTDPYPFIYFIHEQDTLSKIILKQLPALWNATMDQLTLWIDPGRIKRELGPQAKLGTPFEVGESYTLVVQKGFKSAYGLPLDQDFHQTYIITPADRQSPTPSLIPPTLHSLDPLTIDFHELMDEGTVEDRVKILFEGKSVPIETGPSHLGTYTYIPLQPWQKGTYTVSIASIVEDLAGNNLNRLFDEDLTKGSKAPTDFWFVLKFTL